MSPKISIIVPVYNVEKYLSKCIDSILNQSFKNYELILVDDGSRDNCGEICDKYSKIYKNIKTIHKENGGLSSARNKGLDFAKGDYIVFIDSDDFIDINMLEILYKVISNTNSDIAICDYEKVYEGKEYKQYNNKKVKNLKIFNNVQALNEIYTENNVKMVIACNKIYKKEMFYKLRYPENKINEDEYIIHKLLYNAKKVTLIDNKMYYYVQRENSIMNKSISIKNFDVLEAFQDRIEFFKKRNLKELEYKAQYSYLNVFLILYFKMLNNNMEYKPFLKRLKRDALKIFIINLNNPFINLKEKILFNIFFINTNLYKYIVNKKWRRKS